MFDSALDGWSETTLGKCADWYSGGTPSTSVPAYWDGDIPWITASSLHEFYLRDSERRITRIGLENGSRLMPKDTIIFVVRGMSLKKEFRVGIAMRPMAFGQDCKAIVAKKWVDARYLANVLRAKAPEIMGLVDEASHGTGRLQTSALQRLSIPLPPLPEQRAIAHILGTLDDKIELNRRMNRTLEEMARALFQSWFVDFDPVRAKARGEAPPGLAPELAALFPDRLVETELGEAPEGWEVKTLGNVAEVVKGRSYRSSDLQDSDTALVTLKSFQRGGGYRPDGLKAYTGTYLSNQVIKPGELIVAYTDVTLQADVIGKPALVRNDQAFRTLVASLDVGIVRPKRPEVSGYYLYSLLLTDRFQNHTYAHSNGSTVLHLGKNAVQSFEFLLPPHRILDTFHDAVWPMYQRIDGNEAENSNLESLRDTLLPKLMSGEVRVPEAAELAGA